MEMSDYVRKQFRRGLSAIEAIGPEDEVRILFDGCCALIAGVLSLVFCNTFVNAARKDWDFLLPLGLAGMLVASNLAIGIALRLRLARARAKVLALALPVVLSVAVGWFLFQNRPAIVLWAMLVSAPVILGRVLSNAPASRPKKLTGLAARRSEPVLVIGGAGYIGTHTVDLLLQRGYTVRVLDRLMYGDKPLADFRNDPRFSLIEGDATNIARLTSAMKDCSTVIHLAGLVGDPACAVNASFTRQANVIATRMAREVAESLGVSRFVFASSCSVYGVSDEAISETGPLNPVSLYAQTKIDSERELLSTLRDEFCVTILRFATVFGHSRRPRFDLVGNLFTAQAMTDGLITVIGPNQWRPFIHVRDLARAMLAVIEAPAEKVQGQIFNIGDSRLNMTILQLAEEVRRIASKYREATITVRENSDDRRNYCVLFEKSKSILRFEAETLISEGIQEMADYFAAGHYADYRSPHYSNVAMTSKTLKAFQNPAELAQLYAPLSTLNGEAMKDRRSAPRRRRQVVHYYPASGSVDQPAVQPS